LQKHFTPPEITRPVVARPQRGRGNLLALGRGEGKRSPRCARDDGGGFRGDSSRWVARVRRARPGLAKSGRSR